MPTDRHPWTPAEDDLLRTVYATQGIRAAMAALPHRTRASIFERAIRRLRLAVRRPPWTEAEDAQLRLLWGDGKPLATLATLLKRPAQGVYRRAAILGLPLGCPQGYEYLTDAAERVGMSRGLLRKILVAAQVRLYRSLTLKHSRQPRHVVDSGDVDEAVDAYLATEPVGPAARRVGVCEHKLRACLRAIGVERAPGRRRVLRVTPEQVARAVGVGRKEARA